MRREHAAYTCTAYALSQQAKPFFFVPRINAGSYRAGIDGSPSAPRDRARRSEHPVSLIPADSCFMKIVGISGSPTAPSRSAALLQLAQQRLEGVGTRFDTIAVRDLPAQALLQAQFDDPALKQAVATVAEAQVVLVSTPIYKAAYSGLVKAFLDLLPQDGLKGKTVLPLATGGSIAHLLALDYALKPVLSALGAQDILAPVFATDTQWTRHPTLGYVATDEVTERLRRSLQTLSERAGVQLAAAPWAANEVRWSV
jgi:FMN reductase